MAVRHLGSRANMHGGAFPSRILPSMPFMMMLQPCLLPSFGRLAPPTSACWVHSGHAMGSQGQVWCARPEVRALSKNKSSEAQDGGCRQDDWPATSPTPCRPVSWTRSVCHRSSFPTSERRPCHKGCVNTEPDVTVVHAQNNDRSSHVRHPMR